MNVGCRISNVEYLVHSLLDIHYSAFIIRYSLFDIQKQRMMISEVNILKIANLQSQIFNR